DAYETAHRRDPDFAVADLARVRRAADGADDGVEAEVVAHDLHLELGDEVDLVLRPPVNLAVTPLPPEGLDVRDGHAVDAEALERLLHIVDLERLDDGGDEIHRSPPSPPTTAPASLPASTCGAADTWPAGARWMTKSG